MVFAAAKEALQQEGLEVEYAGILPTPSMLLLTHELGYGGGIMITASHNPPEYNGLKFILSEGRLTNETEVIELQKIFDGLTEEDKKLSGTVSPDEAGNIDNSRFRKIHVDKVLASVDAELVRSKKFKVAVDSINSGGGPFAKDLLEQLGCEVRQINGTPDGNFAHRPEPLEKNLAGTLEFFKQAEADICFVQDPDADRLVLADERGNFVLEELMIALVIKSVLSRKSESGREKSAVVNLSTTRVCEDIAREYGAALYRTRVGEAYVVKKMMEVNAPVGGEGSGGAIYPAVGYFRDSLSGMALILELLARDGRKISEIVASLPKYVMLKENITFTGNPPALYDALRAKWPGAQENTEDGIRFDWPSKAWMHIRTSNTEPLLRIFGEAKTEEEAKGLFEDVRLTLKAI
jgi:phosphomannomutase